MIRFVLVLYSISVSRVALTDLMDLAVPFPAEKSVGQMVMPIALGLLRRCFLVGFPDKVGGFETSPISRKLRGCFFLQISLEFSPQAMFLYHQAIPTMMNQLMFAVQYV